MATKIQLRRDTAANWSSLNPVLAQGEPGLELDTSNLKIGDGVTQWTGLSYITNTNSASTGDYVFSGNEVNTGDGGTMVITPNEGASWLFLPSDSAAADGAEIGRAHV